VNEGNRYDASIADLPNTKERFSYAEVIDHYQNMFLHLRLCPTLAFRKPILKYLELASVLPEPNGMLEASA